MIDIVSERLQFSAPGRGKRLLPVQRPAAGARGGVLLAHCFAADDDRYTLKRLSRGLAEAGYVVLRWDFTGLGETPGVDVDPMATTTMDLQRAATLLAQHSELSAISLVGHGVANTALLPLASSVRRLASVVAIGAPATARAVRKLFDSPRGRASDEHSVTAAGRTFPLDAAVLEEFAAFERDRLVSDLNAPFLVVHALGDEVVPVEEGERLFATATQPKSFVPLVDADHLLRSPAAGEQVLRVVADWLHRTRPPNLRQ